MSISNGVDYKFRFQATGTTLRAKVWLASGAEPGAWTMTVTDSTITAAGSTGFSVGGGAAASSSTFVVDDVYIGNPLIMVTTGQPTETDTGQPVTRKKARGVVRTTQTNTSQPVARRKTRTLGQATETSTSQSVARALVTSTTTFDGTDGAPWPATWVFGRDPVTGWWRHTPGRRRAAHGMSLQDFIRSWAEHAD